MEEAPAKEAEDLEMVLAESLGALVSCLSLSLLVNCCDECGCWLSDRHLAEACSRALAMVACMMRSSVSCSTLVATTLCGRGGGVPLSDMAEGSHSERARRLRTESRLKLGTARRGNDYNYLKN